MRAAAPTPIERPGARVARRGAESDRSDFTRRPADPGQAVRGRAPVRRQGPGRVVPGDRAAAATGGRAQRARHLARRRRLRRVERVRRAVRDADG